jgi:hypothetical protein
VLSGPCNVQFYTDGSGRKRLSHLLKDGRQFQRLQEAYNNMHHQAINQGHPPVPGTITYNVLPPTPSLVPHGALAAVATQQRRKFLLILLTPMMYTQNH